MEDSEAWASRTERMEGLEHNVGGYDRSTISGMRGSDEARVWE